MIFIISWSISFIIITLVICQKLFFSYSIILILFQFSKFPSVFKKQVCKVPTIYQDDDGIGLQNDVCLIHSTLWFFFQRVLYFSGITALHHSFTWVFKRLKLGNIQEQLNQSRLVVFFLMYECIACAYFKSKYDNNNLNCKKLKYFNLSSTLDLRMEK